MSSSKSCIGAGAFGCLLLIAGCGAPPSHEADYTYEVVKKAADGSTQVVDKGKAEREAVGDSGGFEHPGIGMIRTGVRRIDKEGATIEVTYPDETTGKLELRPNETKEHFHKGGDYGVRVTLAAIRSR
jgi:hypothetical protein